MVITQIIEAVGNRKFGTWSLQQKGVEPAKPPETVLTWECAGIRRDIQSAHAEDMLQRENSPRPPPGVSSWQGLQRWRLRATESGDDPESATLSWLWEGRTLPTNDRVRPV